jgi:hypothetical protein
MARPSFQIKNPVTALVVGSLVLLGTGYWMASTVWFAVGAEEAVGQVTRASSCSGRRKSGLCGDIAFTTRDGRQEVMRDARGIGPTGTQETVLYNPRNPDDVRQAGLTKMWIGPVLGVALGVAFFLDGLRKFLNR